MDTKELEVDEHGNVKGLDNFMSNFKEENSYLFEQPKPTGKTPDDGSTPKNRKRGLNFYNRSELHGKTY